MFRKTFHRKNVLAFVRRSNSLNSSLFNPNWWTTLLARIGKESIELRTLESNSGRKVSWFVKDGSSDSWYDCFSCSVKVFRNFSTSYILSQNIWNFAFEIGRKGSNLFLLIIGISSNATFDCKRYKYACSRTCEIEFREDYIMVRYNGVTTRASEIVPIQKEFAYFLLQCCIITNILSDGVELFYSHTHSYDHFGRVLHVNRCSPLLCFSNISFGR